MQVFHRLVSPAAGGPLPSASPDGLRPQFALVFGPRRVVAQREVVAGLRAAYPDTRLLIGSSSGDISGAALSDEKIAVTAVRLARSTIGCATVVVSGRGDSREAGRDLARQLARPDLRHVFVLCDGRAVNGTQFALGLNETLPRTTTVTGGLAGDGTAFEETLVGLDEVPTPNRIAAIGLYSRHLRVGYGSSGGWIPFGPERIVTRADGHELFELDGQPALALYKKYLGDAAADLPSSALRFPLWVRPAGGGAAVVRTPHRIDEATGSLDFAGDIPERASVRMLRASYEDLIDGAGRAAEDAMKGQAEPELAICVSCVARRIVLGQRTEEELENVRDVVGANTPLCGFYSYGELAPSNGDPECRFHNQTMTITTLREEPA